MANMISFDSRKGAKDAKGKRTGNDPSFVCFVLFVVR